MAIVSIRTPRIHHARFEKRVLGLSPASLIDDRQLPVRLLTLSSSTPKHHILQVLSALKGPWRAGLYGPRVSSALTASSSFALGSPGILIEYL